jgi:serine phosphatase RsbU (regulator of sigma subunit)
VTSAEKQRAYLTKVEGLHHHLQQWASTAPMNFQHKVDLIAAEMARIHGDTLTAMNLYGRAIQGAQDSEYPQEEALAYEREAQFYLELGRDDLAMLCLTKAWDGYRRWGATCKVSALEQRHKHLLLMSAPVAGIRPGTTTVTSSRTTSELLDTSAIIKTTRVLSQEVELPRLLEKMIQIVLENAGAERGVFIEQRQEQFLIQANGRMDRDRIDTMQALPLEDAEDLPLAVIYYVARTLLPLVLRNAAEDQTYAADRYIRTHAPKSILCLPILHQDKLLAILYLENNLIPGAFTADRLELLKMLTSQAAISMEIARHIEQIGEQERLKKEMELAQRIQMAILPKHVDHPELEIETVMLPAEEVGGDYYDIISGKDGALWIAIGDVSGHGVTPGLIMMMAQTIHATLTTQVDVTPQEVLTMLNTVLYHNVQQRLEESHFMTFTTLKHLGNGRFQHAGAHLDLIVHRAALGNCDVLDTPGTWLNFIPDISHATENSEFTLEIGDTLVLYTDGLTEAHVPGGDILDIHRFAEIVQGHAGLDVPAMRDAIMHDVLEWCDHVRDDDMSLVIVRRKA